MGIVYTSTDKYRQYINDYLTWERENVVYDIYRQKCRYRSYSKQEKIAKVLGITEVHFSRIMQGRVKLSLEMLIKLAWLCDITLEDILSEEKELGLIDDDLLFFLNI